MRQIKFTNQKETFVTDLYYYDRPAAHHVSGIKVFILEKDLMLDNLRRELSYRGESTDDIHILSYHIPQDEYTKARKEAERNNNPDILERLI